MFYRWVKFEEDVEEKGGKWSKPHVASLSLHALFDLKNLMSEGHVVLDANVASIVDLAGEIYNVVCTILK